MANVFISHSSADIDRAEQIRDAVRQDPARAQRVAPTPHSAIHAVWRPVPIQGTNVPASPHTERANSTARVPVRKLFISYARQNKRDIDQLVEHLRVLGCDTWHDSLLHGGQDWWEEILQRIADCDTFIAIISRDALSSTACRREFEWAESLDKPVLPVAVEPPPKGLPRRFSKLQIVDYSDPEARDRAALTLGGGLATLPAAPGLPDPLPEPPEAPLSSLTDLADLVTYQLIDLVTQKDALDHDQQRHILNQLERVLRSVDPEQRRGGRDILEMFSGRDDLYPDVDCTTTRLRIISDEQATTRIPSTVAETEPFTTTSDTILGDDVPSREKTERSVQEQQPGANRTPIREHPAAFPSAAPPLRQRLGYVSRLCVFRGVDRRKIVLGALSVWRGVTAGLAVWHGQRSCSAP